MKKLFALVILATALAGCQKPEPEEVTGHVVADQFDVSCEKLGTVVYAGVSVGPAYTEELGNENWVISFVQAEDEELVRLENADCSFDKK